MQEQDDSLGIFADVITGALGVVMFVALFFALRALSSSTGISGVEVRPELRSELTAQQLDVARARQVELGSLGIGDTNTERAAQPRVEPAEVDPIAAARRRDFVRQQIRLVELEVLENAADNVRAEYAARRERAIEEFVRTSGTPIAPAPRAPAARQFYVFVKADRVHPLYAVRDGEVRRDTEHVGWLLYDNGRQMRAFPQSGRGWESGAAVAHLRGLATSVGALGWEIILLTTPDGFATTRQLLRELGDAGIALRWRPATAGDYIALAVDVAPPL